jgi:hypothetical protein
MSFNQTLVDGPGKWDFALMTHLNAIHWRGAAAPLSDGRAW